MRLLPSDFPAENPRTQTRTFHTRTVGNNYEKPVSKENITSNNDVDFIQLICM